MADTENALHANASEDLQERTARLCERFPTISAERVLQVLRDNGGHAGYAAADLRALSVDVLKSTDPEDSEYVATLLSNPNVFKQTCKAHFKKFDVNRNGIIRWEEVLALINTLCVYMGIEPPLEKSLQAFFESSHANRDGVLTEREFPKFFESFLRYAFFIQHRTLVGTWRYKADSCGSSSPTDFSSRSYEFTITLGKDYRLHYRSHRGCPGAPKAQAAHGPGRPEVYGTLELRDGWLQAELKSGTRDLEKRGSFINETFFGVLRLRFAEGNTEKVVTHFKIDPQVGWGKDITAKRIRSIEQERASQPSTPTTVGGLLKCIAPQGIAYRRSPEYIERTDVLLQPGETVRIVERHLDTHWVRVAGGWLPTLDPRGAQLFELMPSLSQSLAQSE
jgi:hypothetical protein